MRKYHFKHIYELVHLVDDAVEGETEFWNFDEDVFIESATRFSKDTLLHLYIVITAINYYRYDLRKNGNFYDFWREKYVTLFRDYGIDIKVTRTQDDERALIWFDKNLDAFEELFSKMSEEAFYILFANRTFLFKFNKIVATAIYGDVNIPVKFKTKKDTIKRCTIPSWVKKAVFHRDKGRCVFCNTDLTNLINTLTNTNYDHMVALDSYGANDPCNIQLTCEACNKSKSSTKNSTSDDYMPWW